MEIYTLLAESFEYPGMGRVERLEAGLAQVDDSPAKVELAAFVHAVARLSLAEWEETHTRTLDLNPAAAPYVGFQTWGETYQRGSFMAALNRELFEHAIDLEGELPDHMVPILRYLGVVEQPLPELVDVLPAAVNRMLSVLSKAERGNPYVHLFKAVLLACTPRLVKA